MRHTIDPVKFLSVQCNDDVASPTSGDSNDSYSLNTILPESKFFAGEDVCFHSIASTADQANDGELVVYRIGEASPEQLIADAMARGAAGILTEQLLPTPLPQCIVGDVELAMARITAEMCGRPDRKLLTVGVIGPAGKTTTTLLVASLLRSIGVRVAYQTDLGVCDGVIQETLETPIPSGAPLVEWISEATESRCMAALVELSDNDLRHGNYDAIQFDLLIVTGNTSVDEDYGQSGLQCALERLMPSAVVVAPADDPKAMRIIRDSGVRTVTYGVRNAADVTAKIIDQSGGLSTLMVTHHDTTTIMETPLCGAAMAANHAAAAVVGLLVDVQLPRIVTALSQLRMIPGRGERLESIQHANVIIDAGGSAERCTSALRAARSTKGGGRLWCVFAIDCDDDPHRLAEYGSKLERFATDCVVTVADNNSSSFLQASHAVLDGVKKCAAMRLVADRQRAIRWAVAEANPGDTILVLGGIAGNTAHQQRTKIAEVTKWVEAEREHVQQTPQESSKPALKIFK